MTSKGNQGKTSLHLFEICGCNFFFFLLEVKFVSRVGIAAVDDQTEYVFSLWKTDFAFLYILLRFINFPVLSV